MIRIFLLDRRLLSETAEVNFGEAEATRLDKIKNPKRKLESLSALVALDELIKISLGQASFEILRSKSGKPYFKDSSISFSLAHSGDISVAAICDEKDNVIGIDVEKINERSNITELAERFFNESEKAEFYRLGKAPETFFELWTKKEAYAKMTGEGLASVIGDQSIAKVSNSRSMCYEFYNNNDRYILSLCSSSTIQCVEFYNNSKDVKFKQEQEKGGKK